MILRLLERDEHEQCEDCEGPAHVSLTRGGVSPTRYLLCSLCLALRLVGWRAERPSPPQSVRAA